MNEELILYRGDSQKIKYFHFHMTEKFCLVGQGIYLTDNEDIANTYRKKDFKGNRKNITDSVVTLFHYYTFNRETAFEEAYKEFLSILYFEEEGKGIVQIKDKKILDKINLKYKSLWKKLIEERKITAEYCTSFPDKQNRRIIIIKWKRDDIKLPGSISVFRFPKNLFERNIIHFQKPIADSGFWEIMYENEFFKVDLKESKEDYIQRHKYKKLHDCLRRHKEIDKLRKILKPYGIFGFEYDGGVVSNGIRHRAFCIWDEEFVNSHRVK